MASQWQTLGRKLGKIAVNTLEQVVFREGPKVLRQLQGSEFVQRGLQLGLEAIGVVEPEQQTAIPGRPVTNRSVPTAHRARRISTPPTWMGAPIPARSYGPGWSTRTTQHRARIAPCWWWGAMARCCWA